MTRTLPLLAALAVAFAVAAPAAAQDAAPPQRVVLDDGTVLAGAVTERADAAVALGTLSGVRFFSDRLADDLAVALGAADGGFTTVPIPYLGLSYTF